MCLSTIKQICDLLMYGWADRQVGRHVSGHVGRGLGVLVGVQAEGWADGYVDEQACI